MKQIYSVFTYYQLITAIQIKTKIYPEERADIVISDHSAGYLECANRLKKLEIFENVYTAKSVEGMNVDTTFKKIKRIFDIVMDINNFAVECSNIETLKYDEFLFFNYNYFDNCLYYLMKERNPRLICRRFEEGYTSGFKFDIFITKSAALQEKIRKIFKRPSPFEVEQMFFYEPELVLFDNNVKISEIPKISRKDNETKYILNKLFGIPLPEEYDRKYIFFEESFYTDNVDIDDLSIVLKIAQKVGKENIMVKLHPRTKHDRFAEFGIKTNENVGIPWEAVILNNDFSDKVFLTISSGSVLSPRIIFGENVKTYMLFNCTEKLSPIVNENFYTYLKRFENKYGKSGFIIPENIKNFFDEL